MAQRIVIMAGGTGGHVFPALAVAQYCLEKGWEVSWLGTHQGLESRVIPEQGIEIDWLSVAGVRGKGFFSKLTASLGVIKACIQALLVLVRRKPQVVLGMGGFVSGPGGLMARLLGIPLVIHEQNKVPGTTNRLLSKVTDNVLEAFEGSFKPQVKALWTGNPLRKALMNLSKTADWTNAREFRILIIGGSQGAAILNTTVPDALAHTPNIAIKHQTGSAMLAEVQAHYSKLGVVAEAIAFISDMSAAYEWADMLICRAGAMTISELAAAGKPAVLVPLPNAIDDHQVANAKVLAEAGGAIILLQADLNSSNLLRDIQQVQKHNVMMSNNAKKMARLDATKQVAEFCMARAKS
ncbi:MAG: undecaprenyldiphospho-muramoylpentapeptide beta-N-acetylglucosaminyltransferase [Methylococcaceae bacterium]|nr:undecaprenyldiphospho-muramoylpentapeptide beta-N-acetylglucosaminyltransferase [Methylococcaceae bacterium]